jgi:hypothetical protein
MRNISRIGFVNFSEKFVNRNFQNTNLTSFTNQIVESIKTLLETEKSEVISFFFAEQTMLKKGK